MQPQDSEAELPQERRAHPRTPCWHKCRIAPYQGGLNLINRNFELVQLNDISVGGFSYWATRLPQDAELAFLLTDQPTAAVFLSQVRHVRYLMGHYIVGCQIVRLLSNSAAALVTARRCAKILPENREGFRGHQAVAGRNQFEVSRLESADSEQAVLPNSEETHAASPTAIIGNGSLLPDELRTLLNFEIPSTESVAAMLRPE